MGVCVRQRLDTNPKNASAYSVTAVDLPWRLAAAAWA